jgi:branched-chain amino acid transport system permease protein
MMAREGNKARAAGAIAATIVAVAGLVVGLVVGLAAFGNNYLLQVGTSLAMYVVLCLAWNVVGGFMGYPSFATAAFFGLGTYAAAILENAGGPFLAGWVAAAAAGAVFAAVLGAILLGLRGHYFAIGSIAVVEVMREVANNWEGLTGGAVGLNLPIMAGSANAVGVFFFLAMWGLAGLAWGASVLIARARFGFGLRCIRQNEDAARMVGIEVFRYKLAAFVISGTMASAAGGVYASMVAFIEPNDVFSVLLSIEVPVMVMLGGAGSVVGPLLGACLFSVLNEVVWVNFINFHAAILGLIIIVVIYLLPRGVLGPLQTALSARRQRVTTGQAG